MFCYNNEQERVINNAVNHVLHPTSKQVYQFSGKAGTGKTTVMMEIIRRIGYPLRDIAIMAYIGQAATVMRTKGLYNAKTAHANLYQLTEVNVLDEFGMPIMDPVYNKPKVELKFMPKEFDDNIKYVIIDEGGTFPFRMKYEVERRGLPIIVAGDVNQLPPVADKPAYLIDGYADDYLNQIMRQAEYSAIPYIAERILEGKPISEGIYGNVLVIRRKDLTDDMIASSNILLCGTNKTREFYNRHIRRDMLKIDCPTPLGGEKIICRKNNWHLSVDGISLTNGLIGQVVTPPTVSTYSDKKFTIDFKPDLLNSYFANLECDYEYFTANPEQRQFLKNSPYNNGEKFESAYSITTHLSQGAQYPVGIYIQEYLHKDIQKNLNYTGATRFSKYLIYVLPDKKYF